MMPTEMSDWFVDFLNNDYMAYYACLSQATSILLCAANGDVSIANSVDVALFAVGMHANHSRAPTAIIPWMLPGPEFEEINSVPALLIVR